MSTTNLASLLNGGDAGDIYVLTKEGLASLTKEIFKNVNNRIEDRIVYSLDDTSDVDHVPSANTVFNAVKGLSKVKNLIISDGDITKAHVAPDPSTLYVVRKSSSDTKAIMYIFIENIGYINCSGGGDFNAGSDITVNAIPNDVIAQIVSSSYQETDPGIDPVPVDDEE